MCVCFGSLSVGGKQSLSANAAVHHERLVWRKHQQVARSTLAMDNERLKGRIQQLSRENCELSRQLKNERIRNREEEAAERREMRQAVLKSRLDARAAHRFQVCQSVVVKEANMHIKQLEEVNYVGHKRCQQKLISNFKQTTFACAYCYRWKLLFFYNILF